METVQQTKSKGQKIPFRIGVDITKMDIFLNTTELFSKCLCDERIPEDIREEYKEKLLGLCNKNQ